jgi:hypothetical protein
MLQPPWLSAHFRISFTPTETGPLRSAFGPGTSAPTSGFHRHRRPSGRATVPCTTDCRPPPQAKSQPLRRYAAFTSPTESVLSRLLFPFNSFEADEE